MRLAVCSDAGRALVARLCPLSSNSQRRDGVCRWELSFRLSQLVASVPLVFLDFMSPVLVLAVPSPPSLHVRLLLVVLAPLAPCLHPAGRCRRPALPAPQALAGVFPSVAPSRTPPSARLPGPPPPRSPRPCAGALVRSAVRCYRVCSRSPRAHRVAPCSCVQLQLHVARLALRPAVPRGFAALMLVAITRGVRAQSARLSMNGARARAGATQRCPRRVCLGSRAGRPPGHGMLKN